MALTTEPVTRVLPIADMASVRAHARGLLREHRSTLLIVIGLHALAALAALIAPRLVGALVDGVTHRTTPSRTPTLATPPAASRPSGALVRRVPGPERDASGHSCGALG